MVIAVLLCWLPAILLVASAVRRKRDRRTAYVSTRTGLRSEQEPTSLHDYGLGRLGSAVALVVLGVLTAASIPPFAGSKARRTTTIRLPDSTAGFARVTQLSKTQRAALAEASHSDVTQLDAGGYGASRTPSGTALFVLAGRGDFPVGKIEQTPGRILHELVEGESWVSYLNAPGTDVDPGDVAQHARCWSYQDKGAVGCEFYGDTFFVEIVDYQAAGIDEAAARGRTVVSDSVFTHGRSPQQGTQA